VETLLLTGCHRPKVTVGSYSTAHAQYCQQGGSTVPVPLPQVRIKTVQLRLAFRVWGLGCSSKHL